MEIKKELAPQNRLKSKPQDESKLGFGIIRTDHMLIVNYDQKRGWHDARIVPYGPLPLDPAAMCLHYGQEIFEGLKCYRRPDGGLQLFRPKDNFTRFNRSAVRMCMPELDMDFALESLKQLLRLEADWVPRTSGASLYIRPTMIASEPHLGVRPAKEFTYFVILGPVGAYYPEGFNPIKILVEDKYTRAAPGQTGEAKTAANYAISIYPAEKAHEKGFAQVLYLDGVERKYVEEVGAMNMFFLIGNELITAPLAGTILPGVTRATVLDLAREWGHYRVSERKVAIDEVIAAAKNGQLKEAFGSGTAAVISPVGQIVYKDEALPVADGRTGPLSQRLYDTITGIQYGLIPDPHGWIEKV